MSKKNNNDNKPEKNKDDNAKNSMFDSMKSSLINKYKLDDLKEEMTEVEELDAQKSVDEGVVTPQTCSADNIGWNNWKILLRNFIYGIFMGFSDVVPGYSGGTTLSIIGFFDNLVSNIKLLIKPDIPKYFWKYLIWLIPFFAAWLGIFIGFSKIISIASENGNGIILVFLYGFFALFSIPLFYIKNKKDLVNFKSLDNDIKQKDKSTLIKFSLFIFGILLMLSFALMARFIPTSTNQFDYSEIRGVTYLGDKSIYSGVGNNISFDGSKVIGWLICGFFSGFCMLIPGISGGLVLYMTNVYPEFTFSLSHMFQDANLIPWVVIVVIGAILGIFSSTFVIKWFMNKFEKYFMCFCFGLVCSSFLAIFVALSSQDYATLSNPTNIGGCIGMIFVALFVNALIFVILNETHKIDYPKYRFLQRYFDKKTPPIN